ncbi:uncharacterized protein LOC144158241 isoform X3 [Haemaphysalis longicornis]
MPASSVMATSMDGSCRRDASSSQYTQATISTGAMGTQCCLKFHKGASSQTEDEFSVQELNTGAASEDGADIADQTRPCCCACKPHSGNTGNLKECSHDFKFFWPIYTRCVDLLHIIGN